MGERSVADRQPIVGSASFTHHTAYCNEYSDVLFISDQIDWFDVSLSSVARHWQCPSPTVTICADAANTPLPPNAQRYSIATKARETAAATTLPGETKK